MCSVVAALIAKREHQHNMQQAGGILLCRRREILGEPTSILNYTELAESYMYRIHTCIQRYGRMVQVYNTIQLHNISWCCHRDNWSPGPPLLHYLLYRNNNNNPPSSQMRILKLCIGWHRRDSVRDWLRYYVTSVLMFIFVIYTVVIII